MLNPAFQNICKQIDCGENIHSQVCHSFERSVAQFAKFVEVGAVFITPAVPILPRWVYGERGRDEYCPYSANNASSFSSIVFAVG